MTLRCGGCGNDMVVESALEDGTHVQCPFCGETTVYSKPSRIEVPIGQTRSQSENSPREDQPSRPKLKVIRPQMQQSTRMAASQTPVPCPPSVTPPRRSPAKSSGGGNGLLLGVIAALCVGVGLWWYHKSLLESDENPQDAISVRDARSQQDEDELRRKKQAEEEERLRRERQQERERKEKEREAQRAEQKRKAEADRQRRETYREAQDAFRGKPSYFAVSAPQDRVVDPRVATSEMRLWCVDKSYSSDGVIYEIRTCSKGIETIKELSLTGGPKDIDVEEFKKRIDSSVWAIASEGEIWILGTGKQARFAPISKDCGDVCPLADEIGDADAAFESLRMTLPEVRYRMTLKPKSGGDDIPLGVIDGSQRLSGDKIRAAVKGVLAERKLASAGANLKRPKIKKYKPKVVLYDGEKIVKKMDGSTLVPKSFKFLGTSRYHDEKRHVQDIVDKARRKWEELKQEAERQERKADDVEASNFAAIQEYKRKLDELSRNISVTEREILSELQKYSLYVERSRTRLPK